MPSHRKLRMIYSRCIQQAEGRGAVSEQFAITMLGGFDVYRDNQLLDLPPSCRRVVALAALKRLRPMGAEGLLVVTPRSIAIAPDVRVDWYDAVELIGWLLGHTDPGEPDRDLTAELLPLLRAGALLDGWTDEWNAYARSTYRDLRLDALDELVEAWVGNG
jgi:hypothetical protein